MILREWVKQTELNGGAKPVDQVKRRALEPRSDPYSRLIETAQSRL